MRIELLKDIAEIIAGQSPPSDTYNKLGEGIPFFQGMADYGERVPVIRNWCRQPTKISLPNDILISVRAPVGPVIINNVEACIGRGISAIRANKNYSSEYIFYFLKANEKQISNLGVGSTFTAITQKDLGKIEISIPETLADQIKIANVLSRAEALIKQRKENIELLDEFTRTVFHKRFIEISHEERKLVELTTKITDGEHRKPDYKESGIPFISVTNITTGTLSFKNCKFVSKADYEKHIKRCNPELNDILYTKVGATYGRAALVNIDSPFSLYVSVALIKPNHDLINTTFLRFALNHPFLKRQADKSIKGAGVPDLHLIEIKSFKIPFPTMKEQVDFAILAEKAEALKEQLKNGLNDLENLYGSLSKKAFKGELDLSELEISHIVPLSTGGSTDISNLEVISKAENKSITDKLWKEEDKRYGDPFEVDEATAKKRGKDFYKQWKEMHQVVKPHKFYGGGEATISWEWLANLIKERYEDKHFNFEMLMNLVKKEKLEDATHYYSSEEMKANPKLNETEDLKSFIQTAVINVLMDEEQARKVNPFLKVKQSFYNAEKENFQLNLHKEDFKLLKNKTTKQRSGIYFNVEQ